MKRFYVVLFLLLVGVDISIHAANNLIADSVCRGLLEYAESIPVKSVESISLAGKVFGCSNGMQYTGALFIDKSIKPDVTQVFESLPNAKVEESAVSPLLSYFSNSQPLDSREGFIVSVTYDQEGGELSFPDWVWGVLNHDFRGH